MKLWKRIAALCLVCSLCLSLFACGKKPGETTAATTGTQTDKTGTYTVCVTSESGTAFEGIGVYIYEDASQAELVWFAKTDAEGKISFEETIADGYVAVLDKVPQGYVVEEQYPLTGLETSIVLAVEMAAEVDLSTASFKLGDVMYDLTVTDVNGETWQLSQLLEQKKAVMLNFWYLGCTPCRMEFPHLQEAYEKYSDKVEVLALNPVDGDDASIGAYAKEMGLTFPMAQCDPNLAKAMNLVSYPTTVIIDRSGVISLSHVGSLDSAKDFEDIFAHFTADDYKPGVVEDLKAILKEDEEEEEPINNPSQISSVTTAQLTVRAGEVVYCDIYRMDGMYMTIQSENAEVRYEGETYKPQNGVVQVVLHCKDTRTPTTIGLYNSGEKTETFTLNFSAPQGTLNNPIPLKLGKFQVSIPAGEEEGIYYSYKAEKDGYLTVRCTGATKGVPYDYTLYNLNTYANRNLSADAVKDEDGNTVVQVKIRKGDTIQFSASALPDDSGAYPAIKLKFEAKVTDKAVGDEKDDVKKAAYAVTVTDENRKGVSGVQVYLEELTAKEDAKPTKETLTTKKDGVAASMLPVGAYKVTLKVPMGYTAYTTEFTLTEENPTVAVKFDTLVTENQTYTIKVVDKDGKGISGATVVIGGQSLTTNSKGVATVELPMGTYTVEVGLPDGTVISGGSVDAAKPTLTVTAEGGAGGEEKPGESYQVTVQDYYGNPMKNVTVTFQRDGAAVGMVKTNASGVAAMKLEKGTYTVSLAFGSGVYYYEAAQLTEDTTAITVTVYAKRGDAYTELYVGYAYHLDMGATYVDGMQANVPNYFIFKPVQSGVYRFTTNDPNAVISYWGATDAYIVNQTNVTDYADNAYTREFREDQIGNSMVIIGVTGAAECVVEITRTGDVQLSDEEKAEWIIFEGTQTPKEGTTYKVKESGTLTYVDIKGATADYKIVKGSDGFYHLGSASGPLLYVNLGPNGKYISFYQMMGFEQAGGTNMHQVFYDENGKFLKKEDYTACLKAYAGAVDANAYGLYPLTEDLVYILQNGGENKQWWNEESPNYLFLNSNQEPIPGINTEIAWMFNCCYFK